MEELDEILKKVWEKYYPLRVFNPDNELLKYFIFDNNGFNQNQNLEIKDEFLGRFRGDFPTIDDLEERGVKISLLEYGRGLVSIILQNYCDALGEELKIPELRN